MNRLHCHSTALVLLTALATMAFFPSPARASAPVKVWEQPTVIPTYEAGPPEPNPMFFFGRQSQGAEGRIYPYPLYDTLTGKKVDKTYNVVYLENEYVRIGILPEIGGRLFEAVDKTNGYHFFYRQHVIKPALIGLIGAWISGGIEWNIPHHHRASTFLPVQHVVRDNDDGGKTVWVGELELRHRMRWAVGYTLRPGSSVLEAKVRIVNRTPVANSMLCFANAAVHVNENYQVIFPPHTQYVTYHSKHEFTTWPIATGHYASSDFGKGTDVSWFKNHDAATSMFAWNYEDDFFAGYDHGAKAGTMSVADHHLVPGKKLWTWGNGPRGRMWDHILTDSDGPYIELMVGAYSDNQPDYSWLQPYETRWLTMSWYPFREIAGVKKANLDAAVNLDVAGEKATVGFHTTSAHEEASARVTAGGKAILEETVAIDPAHPFVRQVTVPPGVDPHDVRASLSVNGKELVAYAPVRLEPMPKPSPVKDPPPPGEVKTTEELYLAGLRIDQFHSPAYDPEPYWEEALNRDPGDVRVNTVLGLTLLKHARFADAEGHFRKALARVTAGYTTPKDGEPYYYLGVAMKAQGRLDEADDAFSRSTWAAAWRAPGYQGRAEIASLRGDFPRCLELVDRSLEADAWSIRGLNLKAAALRHLGRKNDALLVLERAARDVDPLDVRSMAERWLSSDQPSDQANMLAAMKRAPATALETAAEYQNAGLWTDGTTVLAAFVNSVDPPRVSPLVFYDLAFFADKIDGKVTAGACRMQARALPAESVFPFQAESVEVLRAAMKADPSDARAPFYLGNLLYDWQPDEAVKLWEASAALDPSLAVVHRNLAIAASRRAKGNDLARAIAELEKAVSLPDKYPLHFFELDELYEAAGTTPEKRLARLEANHEIVARRDDALGREINVRVLMGQYDQAIQLMTGRQFAVWEGGALSVADDWTEAHLLRGVQHMAAGQPREALADFQAAGNVPENLPSESRDGTARKAEIAYRIGTAYEALGDMEKAKASWQEASTTGAPGPGRRRGGFFDRGTQGYYRALALRKLGQAGPAETALRGMIRSAEAAIKAASPDVDRSAPFTAQRAQRSRQAQPHLLAGLGHLGLGEKDTARHELTEALRIDPASLDARAALREIEGPVKP